MRKKKEGGRKDRKGEDEDGQADEMSDEDTKENTCGKKIARYERRSRGRTIWRTKKKEKTTRIRISRGQRGMRRNMIRSNNNNIPFKLKLEYMCSGMFIDKIIIWILNIFRVIEKTILFYVVIIF